MSTAKVIAWYSPKGGKVERHELWRIDYDSTRKGPEAALWSLEPPKASVEVDDKVPKPLDMTAVESKPPQVVEREK